jgi:hypothetical protein
MLGLLDAGDRKLEKCWSNCDVVSGEASSVMAKRQGWRGITLKQESHDLRALYR